MSAVDLIAIALAAGVPINAWLYEQSVVAAWREWVSAWGEPGGSRTRRVGPYRELVATLLTCRFCLSHWVPLLLIVFFYLPSLWLREPWDIVVKLPIYSMAATRLSLALGYVLQRIRGDVADNME